MLADAARRRTMLAAGGVVLGLLLAAGLFGGQPDAALSSARTSPSASAGAPLASGPAVPGAPAPSDRGSAPSGAPVAVPPASPADLGPVGPGVPPAPSPSVTLTPQLAARLDGVLERARRTYAIPGVSATIVFADGSSWTGTAGLADVAAKRPVTDDTAFAIASMSKTFTSALILDLVAEERVGLDDAVAPLLPSIRIDPRITVRMLLDHTSGVADYFLNPKIDKALRADRRAEWTADRSLTFVGNPYFRPGRGWKYSNTNYLLLGMLAEKLTGKPLADELRGRYFEPLGLGTAFYQVTEDAHGPVAHGYRFAGTSKKAKPIDLFDGSGTMPFRSVVTAARGAGGIAASSADVARWGRALYGGRVLEPALYAAMVADARQTAKLRPRVPYGLGVQVIKIGRFRTLGHSGRLLGSQGALRYLLGQDTAVAVLTNQSRSDPAVIVRQLLDAAFPPPPKPVPSGSPSASGSPRPSAAP